MAERLQAVELPKAASWLPENVRVVAKMITSGVAKAPIGAVVLALTRGLLKVFGF